MRYDKEGGTDWDTYSGERVQTNASQHCGGHQKVEEREREAKHNLEEDGGEGKKQGEVDELGSSQSGGMKQGVLVRKPYAPTGALSHDDDECSHCITIKACLNFFIYH